METEKTSEESILHIDTDCRKMAPNLKEADEVVGLH
jgi:hypothetical protein